MPKAEMFGFSQRTPAGNLNAFTFVPWGDGRFDFSPETLALLQLLEPHVTAAFRISRRLNTSTALWDAIDRIPTGVVLLDRTGRVLVANSAVERMAALKDGLTLTPTRFTADRAAERRALNRAFAAAAALAANDIRSYALEEAARPVRISRPSGEPPFAVSFSPLAAEFYSEPSPERPAVLALIADLGAESAVAPEALSAMFGYTAAEAQTAALLDRRQMSLF
ncbi:MAG: hypothetical protein AAFR11_09085 [Pseudomonadota bacterium]